MTKNRLLGAPTTSFLSTSPRLDSEIMPQYKAGNIYKDILNKLGQLSYFDLLN